MIVAPNVGCGLLTDRDRIHYGKSLDARTSCGLLTDRDRIHSNTNGLAARRVAACSRAGIGYTTNTGGVVAPSCGLLTGRDRIH